MYKNKGIFAKDFDDCENHINRINAIIKRYKKTKKGQKDNFFIKNKKSHGTYPWLIKE